MKKSNLMSFSELRRNAEEKLGSRPQTADRHSSDNLRLVHELQVHQIELEMQNEELQRTRAELLAKPTKLSDIEMGLIKVHAQSGYDILKNVELPYPIAEVVLQHHERIDGSGYPRGLKGDQILLEAKILAVADVVEAMATNRPYRQALGIDVALAEIEKNKGILYDEKVVEVCLKLFREKGFVFDGGGVS